ncbi:MAG: DUF4214 domain-containing protein [Acidimicrobiales bacterium]
MYLRDRMGGTTTRVSVADDEAEIDGNAYVCGLSRNGRYVSFLAVGGDLPDPTELQVYLRDRRAGTTTLVSANTSGDPAAASNGSSGIYEQYACPVSDDGRYVAFQSDAENLAGGDDNGLGADIYRRDLQTASTLRVSTSTAGLAGTDGSLDPAMSGDGDVVAFDSTAPNLVANDNNGVSDVFVHTVSTGTTQRVSVTAGGQQLAKASTEPAITQDGDKVAFTSAATNLVAGDANGKDDIFVRDRSASTVVRASFPLAGGSDGTGAFVPDISDDGQRVVYSVYINVDQPGDANQDDDVYLHDFATGNTILASDTPDGVAGDGQSYPATISGDGKAIAFASEATDLARNDTNGTTDIYVRDATLDISPFLSTTAFVRQQFVDFEGRTPTAAEQTEWSARMLYGERNPDELIDELAHGTTWSAKRGPLTRLYWAFFLRPPDTSGMAYWTNQLSAGKKLSVVAKQFAASSEFQNKYGALSNQAFVAKIYQNIFERDPDPGGLAYWTKKLDAKQKTRGDVMVNFSESSEGKRRLAPQVDTVLIYLGMLRKMPTLPILLEGVKAIRDDGYPAEIVAQSLRDEAGYVARVDVDG